jgi:hypothetical protein
VLQTDLGMRGAIEFPPVTRCSRRVTSSALVKALGLETLRLALGWVSSETAAFLSVKSR